MVALGLAVAGLSLLPSDAPSFVLFLGLYVTICGGLGLVHRLTRERSWLRVVLRPASAAVHCVLVVRIAMLVLDGTIGGVIVVAAPLLLAFPAGVIVVAAGMGFGRARTRHACGRCGYEIRGLRSAVCPACGLSLRQCPERSWLVPLNPSRPVSSDRPAIRRIGHGQEASFG